MPLIQSNLGSPPALQAQGLEDAVGADTYTEIVTTIAPIQNVYVAFTGTNAVILSLDGGVSNHFTLYQSAIISGLSLPTGAVLMTKNKVAGQNYANLNITVW